MGRLGGRIVLAGVGVALLAVVLAGLISSIALRVEFDRYSRQRQDDRAAQIVASLQGAYERRGRWEAADLEPARQLAATVGATLAVQDDRGTSVLDAAPMDMPSGMADLMRNMHGAALMSLGPERREPIVVSGRTVGTAAIAGLAALVVGLVIARWIARPVGSLASATESLRRGDRGARVRELPSDELGDLGRSFNEMAGSLEREDELRRRVVADVAHELRTPLTSIQGHLEALRDGVLPPDPPTLSALHDEAARLGRLVSDLEALARAEGAGFTLDRRPIDLADVVRDVCAELVDAFRDRGVRLDVDVAPARATADEDRVAQIARNLISNALKFTPSGGRVSVATRGGDGRAIVEVSDTGVGMTEEEAARAFDRFWRAPGAAGVPGSGIGLTIARELALAHGGDVAIESKLGRGSTFRVTLPAT